MSWDPLDLFLPSDLVPGFSYVISCKLHKKSWQGSLCSYLSVHRKLRFGEASE